MLSAREEGGNANRKKGKWEISLNLVAPPREPAEHNGKDFFCGGATFRNIYAVRNRLCSNELVPPFYSNSSFKETDFRKAP